MLNMYDANGRGLVRRTDHSDCSQVIWIDLISPTKAEEQEVEKLLGIDIPTREEMHEIEISSRLYQEKNAHFMTPMVMYAVDQPEPQMAPVTFILTEGKLVTLRYAEPKAFPLFLSRAGQGDLDCSSAVGVTLGIIESVIDREVDLIERLQTETEKVARSVFDNKGGGSTRGRRYDIALKHIGRNSLVASRARESLLSLGRVLTYLREVAVTRGEPEAARRKIETEAHDVVSLTDHLGYINTRLNFMLDATIGMVSIEQNQIIKLFSVAAVMLMPPTLIASIYGMNFKHIPELEFLWGYPMALGGMVLSAVVPYLYFRAKGWL
jgi:magnesium transporter